MSHRPGVPEPTERDPVDVLVEESDPVERSRAHQELARRARARNDDDLAERHLREALDLDPSDETTQEELRRLGRAVTASNDSEPAGGGWLSRWLRRRHG
jgi:hypothetical protein